MGRFEIPYEWNSKEELNTPWMDEETPKDPAQRRDFSPAHNDGLLVSVVQLCPFQFITKIIRNNEQKAFR